jgi:peroxiredoxin
MLEKWRARRTQQDTRHRAVAAVGASAPDFTLPTAHGVEVSLSACLSEGNVLVELLRGTWDPDARRRIALLGQQRESFLTLSTRILLVVCESVGSAARFLEERPTPLTLLLDETRAVARGYGVHQRFTLPRWNIARPASFLVDRCGFIRYAHVARLPIHAAPIDELLAAASSLGAAPARPEQRANKTL